MAKPREQRIELNPPQLHEAQVEIKYSPGRFHVASCGRRMGKTVLGLDLAMSTLVEGKPVGWFAPTYKVLDGAWDDAVKLLLPLMKSINKQERKMITLGDVPFEFWSLDNEDAGRSRKYGRVIIDEAGMVPNLVDIWNNAIRPTLADYRGDAWFFGTPKGKNGFWQLFQRGIRKDHNWVSHQLPTSMNPMLSIREEYEIARDELPDASFKQEWDAQFLDDGGEVFRNVRKLSMLEPASVRVSGHTYVGGMDWGRSGDYSVIAIWDVEDRKQVAIDRFTGVEYSIQRKRVMGHCEKWDLLTLLAERNSIGGPNIEALQDDGLPVYGFDTTNASKKVLVDSFALALEREDVRLIYDEAQVGELEAFEATQLPSGLYRYAAPPGMHDDMVMANLLAYSQVKTRDYTKLLARDHDDSLTDQEKFEAVLKKFKERGGSVTVRL